MRRANAHLALAFLLVLTSASIEVEASHSESACGVLLEYVTPPSDNLAHGYGHVRLSAPSGDTSVLFHHINPTGSPSRTESGATVPGATVCVSGPYVHREGASPYVSPYDLRLARAASPVGAPVTSLPTTSSVGIETGAVSPGSEPVGVESQQGIDTQALAVAASVVTVLTPLIAVFLLSRRARA